MGVEEEYIRDNFNLCGLRGRFTYYDHALEMILSSEAPDEEDLADTEFLEIYRDATDLYTLIHARFIVSPRGLQVMREKFLKSTFGTCPRVHCDRQHVLPVGQSEELRAAKVKIFCPKCEQIYSPKSKFKDLDASSFGTSFTQTFLQSYPSLVPLDPLRPFVPRVFGFRLHNMKSLITRKIEEDQPKQALHSQQGTTNAGQSSAAASEEQRNQDGKDDVPTVSKGGRTNAAV